MKCVRERGAVPFYSKNQERLKEIVTSGRYRWPEDVPAGQTAKGLVTALVTLDPLERLGMYGVQEFLTTRCSEMSIGQRYSRGSIWFVFLLFMLY